MSDHLLSPLHIEKLGHSIEEIRVRALSSIITKYNLQLVDEANLANTKQLLGKLLNWFDFQNHPHEENVLNLILKILEYKNSDLILKEIGISDIKKKLECIEKKLPSRYYHLVSKIKEKVSNIQEDFESVLDLKPKDSYIQFVNIDAKQKCLETKAPSLPTISTNDTETDTSTKSARQVVDNVGDGKACNENGKVIPHDQAVFKLEYFPWQSLVSSDRHVLASIYDGLRYIDNKTSILQSCHFFTDVILKDFPTEIFLQRPLIIQTFFELFECDHEEIRIPVLICLIETVQCLKYRFKFASDISMLNFKQEFFANTQNDSEDGHSGLSEQFHLNLQSSDDGAHFDHEDDEDNSFLKRHQSSLPSFCFALLIQTIPHLARECSLEEHNLILTLINESLTFISINLKHSIWGCDIEVKDKVYQIFGLFLDPLKYHKSRNKIIHNIILTMMVEFLNSFKPPTAVEVGEILPRGIQIELAISLSDVILIMLFPDVHSQILKYVKQMLGQKEKEIIQDYEDALRVCKSMKSAVQFLKFYNKFKKKSEKFACIENALLSLDYHHNLTFIKDFVKDSLLKHSRKNLKEKDTQLRDKILIGLISHSNDVIRTCAYKEIHMQVVKLLGVEEAANPKFEYPGDKLDFLFQTDILTEIICHGLSSTIPEVQKHSSEMTIHLLKGKFFMSENSWNNFIKALHPCLSLLQCFADKSTALGRCVVKMLDPDISATIGLSLIDLFKGNLRLLFSKDNLTRDEAVSRLLWLLTKEDRGDEKLPRVGILRGLNLSAICSSAKPREFARVKQSFYSVGNLCDVVEMLCSDHAEPSVRRSALSQIAIMLEDSDLHSTFLARKGLNAVLRVFNDCLIEKEFHNYPDSVLPIMNILKLLSLHNTTVRQELSARIDVFYCTFRGLLLFSGDEKSRQHGSELLCLLLYSENIILPPDGAFKRKISLPQLIVTKMCLPFLTHVHWKNSVHFEPSNRETLMKNENCSRLLRIYWTAEWLGGFSKILTLNEDDLRSEIFSPGIPDDMKLTREDLLCLKNCALSSSIKEKLYDIQNATTHDAVITSVHRLQSCVMLYDLNKKGCELVASDIPIPYLPWESTLERFLASKPSCRSDELLLFHVIKLLHTLLRVFKSLHLMDWIAKLLTDEFQSLPNVLKTIGNDDFGLKGREIRRAIIELTQEIIATRPENAINEWEFYIYLVSDHLKLDNKQEFYNVAYIDWLLSLLVDITGTWNWSYIDKTQLHEDIVTRVMEIIVAFHCRKDSSRSFMGINIVKNSLLILNHMLSDIKENIKGWEQLWFRALSKVEGHAEDVNYCWLLSLWFVRDPLIRSSAFQLLAGFATTPRSCELLMEEVQIEFEHVWNFGFQTLFDEDESCLVREKCALLLSNLINQGSSVTSGEFLQHLSNVNFYHEMLQIASKLNFACNVDEIWSQGSNEDYKISYVVTTPSLLSAVSVLLLNVVFLDPSSVIERILKSGLYDRLLSTLRDLPDVSLNSEEGMCVEVIKMCTNVCSLISKCISANSEAYSRLIQSQQSVNSLYCLLNCNIFPNKSELSLSYRNRLWEEVLDLLSLLLSGPSAIEDGKKIETCGFSVLNQAMTENGIDDFISSLYLALSNKNSDLRHRSLCFVVNLLGHEIRSRGNVTISDILDRDVSPNAVKESLTDSWKGFAISETLTRHFGIRTCDVLLQSYLISQSVKKGAKNVVSDALSSLLAVCQPAQTFGIDHGLAESIILILKQSFVRFNMETVESLKKQAERKRIDPLLTELEITFRLLCNLLLGNEKAKECVADCGLSDVVHKLWSWCNAKDSLLNVTLKTLCTFTYGSERACRSLVLTSTLTGIGLRKNPGSVTLIHAVINQIAQEMESKSKNHNMEILRLCLQLLSNCCRVTECRSVIAKSQILFCISKLHSNPSARRKIQTEDLISVWFDFFVSFTCYQEGQLSLTKNEDVLDLVINQSTSTKTDLRLKALTILRNICCHQLNRIRMLSFSPFLTLALKILSSKQTNEISLVALMIWSLSFNSQKAKLVFRSAGFENKLIEAKRQCHLMGDTQALNLVDSAIIVLQNK